jgi:hypothetical protein
MKGLRWTIWRDWDGRYEGIGVLWRGWDLIDGLWLYEVIGTLLMDGDSRYEGIALELYEGIGIILLTFFIALMYFVFRVDFLFERKCVLIMSIITQL